MFKTYLSIVCFFGNNYLQPTGISFPYINITYNKNIAFSDCTPYEFVPTAIYHCLLFPFYIVGVFMGIIINIKLSGDWYDGWQ